MKGNDKMQEDVERKKEVKIMTAVLVIEAVFIVIALLWFSNQPESDGGLKDAITLGITIIPIIVLAIGLILTKNNHF